MFTSLSNICNYLDSGQGARRNFEYIDLTVRLHLSNLSHRDVVYTLWKLNDSECLFWDDGIFQLVFEVNRRLIFSWQAALGTMNWHMLY